jgi:hypothetical protein
LTFVHQPCPERSHLRRLRPRVGDDREGAGVLGEAPGGLEAAGEDVAGDQGPGQDGHAEAGDGGVEHQVQMWQAAERGL